MKISLFFIYLATLTHLTCRSPERTHRTGVRHTLALVGSARASVAPLRMTLRKASYLITKLKIAR